MKIRIINPDYGVSPEAMAERCAMLRPFVGPTSPFPWCA